MAAPDPLADIDALLASLPVAPGGQFGGSAPSMYSASSYVTPQSTMWQVYMGRGEKDLDPGRDDGEGGHFARDTHRTGDEILGTDQAAGQIYGWSEKRVRRWADHLVSNGLLKPGEYNFPDLVQMWQGAVEEAGNLYTLGGKKITPWDFIETYAGANGLSGSAGGGGGGPTTETSSVVQEFDDLDARAAAEEAYSALLGRGAKGKEAKALQQALNAYAHAHPQVTTTTKTEDGSGNIDRDSVIKGGVSTAGAQQVAIDAARAEPDHAEYQAATTMFSWLQQALGPTADV